MGIGFHLCEEDTKTGLAEKEKMDKRRDSTMTGYSHYFSIE